LNSDMAFKSEYVHILEILKEHFEVIGLKKKSIVKKFKYSKKIIM